MAHLQYLPSSTVFAQSLKADGGAWGFSGLRLRTLLQQYENLPGSNVPARVKALDEILECVSKASQTQPKSAPIQLVAASLLKEYRMIGHGHQSWSKLRTLHGRDGTANSSRTTFGITPGVNQFTVKDAHTNTATKSTHHTMQLNGAAGNYQLEANDPLHRCWGMLTNADQLFKTWAESNTNLSFFDWAEQLPPTHADHTAIHSLGSVAYLDPSQRASMEVLVAGGRVVKPDRKNPSLTTHYSTSGAVTLFSGDRFAIFVFSQSMQIYSGSHFLRIFHHSSFLSGARVICAGEWAVSDGIPLYISHKTGHYKANAQSLRRLLRLGAKGVNLDHVVVAAQTFATGGVTTKHVYAMELLSNGCDPNPCKNLNAQFVKGYCPFTTKQIEDGTDDFVKSLVKPYVRNYVAMSASKLF
ncbi:MAG: hypothetical protein HY820_06290 [Acidobacteria bacterium]|nr:hypothetical protein [Acidobacteriota bacterium]